MYAIISIKQQNKILQHVYFNEICTNSPGWRGETDLMTINQPLSLFISSKMAEMQKERYTVQEALAAYRMHGWLWEKDAGARPEPIQSTYLKEVEACDIYIG